MISLQHLMLVAGGGAVGAVLRYVTQSGVVAMCGREFPYGTLVVNVAGSFLIGACYVFVTERMLASSAQSPILMGWDVLDGSGFRALVMIGLLGALTTFSTFSFETIELLEQGKITAAGLNILSNVVLCLGACWIALWSTRQLLG